MDIKKVAAQNGMLICEKIVQSSEGKVFIPQAMRSSRRFKVIKSSIKEFKAGDTILCLLNTTGFPLNTKNEVYHVVPGWEVLYVEGKGPVNDYSVLNAITEEVTDKGVAVPEEYQNLTTSTATVVETQDEFLKPGMTVLINKQDDEFGYWPIIIDGKDCFIWPNTKIYASE